MNEWMMVWLDGVDGWMNGVDEWMDGWCGWMNEWMNGWMDGCINGWMNGVDGWMNGQSYALGGCISCVSEWEYEDYHATAVLLSSASCPWVFPFCVIRCPGRREHPSSNEDPTSPAGNSLSYPPPASRAGCHGVASIYMKKQ